MKKTPLYDLHVQEGGKIIDFGGWALPVEYEGIIKEHEIVRTNAGLFDVSHMGEILVKGPDAEKFLQRILTNDLKPIENFQVLYTLMCYPDGGVVDDLIVYKYNSEHYLLVVNAANKDKDYAWLTEHNKDQVTISDVSDSYAQFAIQGPNAQNILQTLTSTDLNNIKFFHFSPEVKIDNISAIVSRTGYTGEDGFELYLRPSDAPALWQILLERGKSHGLRPIGLGARDTLRFEAALPLYGHEISAEISPLEAGLGFFVKFSKDDFIGKKALLKQKEEGLKRRLVAFEMLQRGIPRAGYEVQINGQPIGFITTGGIAPSLNKQIGLALIDAEYAKEGETLDIIIRNRNFKAKIIKKPFYNKKYKKF